MRIGTKSVLFGVHQFAVHPWFVAWAWWKLYGFPWDPRLWVAFFLHDIGYLGKPNMDGLAGERHPVAGAIIMGRLFGQWWHDFVLLHSRFWSKALGRAPSKLCAADKLSLALTPWWLYLPLALASGEIYEYRGLHAAAADGKGKYAADLYSTHVLGKTHRQWLSGVQEYCRGWAYAHRDGGPDMWTGTKLDREHRDTDNANADRIEGARSTP